MNRIHKGVPLNKWKIIERKFIAVSKENEAQLGFTCGIYAIVNLMNNHKYVGQSIHVGKRWKSHKRELSKFAHANAYLQNAWNCYGSESFKFVILEICDEFDLDDKEQLWIEKLSPEYNIARNVYDWGRWKADKNEYPDGYYKTGESFQRPSWHLWVYGGFRKEGIQHRASSSIGG